MEHLRAAGRHLRPILARALNSNQLLILSEAAKNSRMAITSLLASIESRMSVPLSTLKHNARVLRRLGLLSFGNSDPAKPTRLGMLMLELLGPDAEPQGK